MLLQRFALTILSCFLFFAISACRKSARNTDADDDKVQACKNILEQAEKETYPLVQPPALARFGMEGVDAAALPLPADSQLVLGINLAAFAKSGLLDQISRIFSETSLAQSVLTYLGLSPGRAAQALMVGVRFGKNSWMPENVTVAILGTLSSRDTINRLAGLTNLKAWLPQIDLPPVTRDGDAISVAFRGITIWVMPHKDNILLLSNRRDTRTDLASNPDFARMMAPIPRDTALWFAAMEMPRELPPTSKVFERMLSQLKRFTGYLNVDDKLNMEFQMRSQFIHHQAALQAKEILRLGISQGTMFLGPRIQKSFSLDGSSDHENVVSRGPFVRFLFRLDRFQVQYLLQWAGSTIHENGHWIYDRKSGTNASSGTAANP